MKREEFRFIHRLRVRWAEVDMQKIVFNAHYLMYFDTAIADYWRALGLPYEQAMHQLGGDLYVKKATVEYHASARVDDQLDVALKCSHIGRSSMIFDCAIWCGNQHLISGTLVYVFADPGTQTSQPVPVVLRAILQDYESGQSVVRAVQGTWDDLAEPASALRREVFVDEQNVPLNMEADEYDANALHVLISNRLGQPVATGRLLRDAPGVSRAGRIAVKRVLRGTRLGHDVLQALIAAARQRGDHELRLHAQLSAKGFYDRQGFQLIGQPFVEAGIVHQEMLRTL